MGDRADGSQDGPDHPVLRGRAGVGRLPARAGDLLQLNGGVLVVRLLRDWVPAVDGEFVRGARAVGLIPVAVMEWHEDLDGLHATDPGRCFGAAAPRDDAHKVALSDAEEPCVALRDLNEGVWG